jgi:UDP-N-acetylglucosamine 2-epimerase (non-hydrolysing)
MTNSRKKRIAVIYGTRPEAIKVAPLVQELGKSDQIEALCISTQQHSSLLNDALEASSLMTDLEVSAPNRASVQSLVSSIALNLEVPVSECDAVIVQGDTVSAFAGALAGFLQQIPVIHLEAGLRTSSLMSPHPEEGLRRAISHISSLHLAPTHGARENLEREGISSESIVVTGNTSIDAIRDHLARLHSKNLEERNDGKRYCVVTVHRRENWGQPLQRITHAISQLARIYPDIDFICPLHPNPLVRHSFAGLPPQSNLAIVDPMPHDEFVSLLLGCELIFSDSGGIQEEATTLGIPVVILRDETERPEVLDAGIGFIAGTDEQGIVEIGSRLLDMRLNETFVSVETFPFGDGKAGARAAQAIEAFITGESLPTDMAVVS